MTNLLLDQIRFENNNENKLIISIRGPQDGTVLVPAVQEDIRGRGLPGLGIGGRQGHQFSEISGTSEDVDVLRRPDLNPNKRNPMYQIETKFRCRFFGYVELGLSLSEIPVDQRHKILKIAISKLCKTKIENNEEIEIPTAKDHFKGSSDPNHFIFEINVGKSRFRHITTLKFRV